MSDSRDSHGESSVVWGVQLAILGRVIRFDRSRGYGFISADTGGDDIFLHVNDLEFEKNLAAPGTKVQFELEQGDRGKFATAVQLRSFNDQNMASAFPADLRSFDPEDLSDVLTSDEYLREITELLLVSSGSLTSEQIAGVRAAMLKNAVGHRWVED
ncbi:cold-shock protein [Nocardia sp. NPDC055321]